MNYSNVNLRKYNLKTEFTDAFIKMFDKKQMSVHTAPDTPFVLENNREIEQAYYQHAAPKNVKRQTISEELTIRGNAW